LTFDSSLPSFSLPSVGLRELNLGSNQLTDIPKELENLSLLEKLYLDNNGLQSVPEAIYNFMEVGRGDSEVEEGKKVLLCIFLLMACICLC
jgi:Leucine-rich repeat (LRR) protein